MLRVSQRNAGIDALRIFAIVAIVTGHVWAIPVVRDLVYPWHVPVFFFLTGYLWTAKRSFNDELTRRSRTLLKPYIFWGFILYVPFATMLIRSGGSFDALFGPLYGGSAATGLFGTFWFVSVLFASAILWRVLELLPFVVRALVVACGAAMGIFFGPVLASTPFAVGSALPALSFIAAGQLAQHLKARSAATLPVALTVLAASALLILLSISEPLGIKEGNWGTPVLSVVVAIVISWSLVIIAERVSTVLSVKTGTVITRLARTGFTIVLLHPLVIVIGSTLNLPESMVFLLAIAMPMMVGLAALRTPLSQWVTGVSPRRRALRVDT